MNDRPPCPVCNRPLLVERDLLVIPSLNACCLARLYGRPRVPAPKRRN